MDFVLGCGWTHGLGAWLSGCTAVLVAGKTEGPESELDVESSESESESESELESELESEELLSEDELLEDEDDSDELELDESGAIAFVFDGTTFAAVGSSFALFRGRSGSGSGRRFGIFLAERTLDHVRF